MYYFHHHSKLLNVKDYPWDYKTLMEYSLSFILTVSIIIVQIYYL